jgi:hypothetical protein
MGGQADATEDMFSKLESMRAVITEVNTQFKDPVRDFFFIGGLTQPQKYITYEATDGSRTGKDNVHLRVHIRVSLVVRDGTARTGTHRI